MQRRSLVPLLVVPVALATVWTGSASAAAPTSAALALDTAPAAAAPDLQAAKPVVGIVRNGVLKYNRTDVTAPRTARTPVTCTATNAGFIIVNNTGARQQIKLGGKAFGAPLPAGRRAFICGFSSSSFTATFGLANSQSRLRAHFR